jgi:hypothetical protein
MLFLNHSVQAMQLQRRLRCLDPVAAQRDVLLRRIVHPNVDCEYGRDHGFASIRTVEDFRSSVEVCRYEDLRHDIERMMYGEPGVLVSEPVRRFFITSGSTSSSKYIPLTSSFIREKWRAFQTYWGMVRQDHPEVVRGHFIVNFSDGSREGTTPGGALYSSESSFWGTFAGGDRRSEHPLPRQVLNIRDAEARYYTIARILLETDISVLMALNPSTILRLFESLQRHAKLLQEDIRRGGLSPAMNVERDVREYVAARYCGNRARTEELSAILAKGQAGFRAAELWPKLQLAICWRSPMLRPYLNLLTPLLDSVPQRDYITMASEGVIAIPFEDCASGGVLAMDVHFYEFIPEASADSANPPTLLAHELEVGRRYVVVLSTSAGLYRYNLGDVVQVRDFIGTTPVIEFLHRTGRTCSLTGEKLTEDQVVRAVFESASQFGLAFASFTLCPVPQPFPHYALLVELNTASEGSILSKFLSELDRNLGSRNVEYQSKRASGRLGAPEVWVVKAGSYAELRRQSIAAGVSDAQIKPAHLTRDFNWHRQFGIVQQIPCKSAA